MSIQTTTITTTITSTIQQQKRSDPILVLMLSIFQQAGTQ